MTGPQPASTAYASVMAQIHGKAFPPAETWDAATIRWHLGLPGVAGWIDPRGGMILARAAADEMEVLTLAVIPAARRRGIATGLLEAAMTWARSQGARAAFLEVGVANAAAQSLYARAGFAPTGRRRRYYSDGSDALILRCPVKAPDAAAAG